MMKRIATTCLSVLSVVVLLACAALAQSAATAELNVSVKDVKNLIVKTATVTVRNDAKGLTRTATANVDGEYNFALLPPGTYTVTVQAPGFAKVINRDVAVTVGAHVPLPVVLQVATVSEVVDVVGQAGMVETEATSSTTTIDQERIDNLPINGRSYVNFTLTNSQTARDNAPSIGAAPTSGLNIGGQRARSNAVNVDGVDAVDNSTNGIRSTVPQEAVQEFQLITNGYAAEYGRASGGVVNIITRSGTNTFHGNAYGYFRNRAFQAVNPFSNVPDPAYTRVQAGLTAGGALKKDKTFYFVSYETTRRQETGFSTIGQNGYDLVPFDATAAINPLAPAGMFMIQATGKQAAFMNSATFAAMPLTVKQQYAFLVGASSGIAVNGVYPNNFALLSPGGRTRQFPTTCTATNLLCLGLPASFTSLASQAGNYPIAEGTTLVGARLDHRLSSNHSLMLRANVSPSTASGLQVQGQGQNFGQNAYSRTAIQQYRDVAFTAQETASIGTNKVNEFRFQFARRGLLFNYNDRSPLGGNVAVNIVGFSYIGREPFSPVERVEKRYQFTDNFSWQVGHHSIKFGADVNYLPIKADFMVNFGGVYNFGDLSASLFGFPTVFPSFSAVQAYGLGVPQTLVQGVGNPHAEFSNKPVGLFIQDSWKIKSNLTLNYGLRYDVEFLTKAPALNSISDAAYKALGLYNGIPRDSNNFAPRIGIAWDPFSNGKTVVRASYGIFYDHPLLGLQFLAQATDGSYTPQIVLPLGSICTATGTASPLNMNAVNVFQGILAANTCMGALASGFAYAGSQQRFISNAADSYWVNQNYLAHGIPVPFLPFGFPGSRDFQFAYANQANLSIERDLGKGYALSVAYNFSGGRHLNRPINANTPHTELLVQNYQRATAALASVGIVPGNPLYASLIGSSPLTVAACPSALGFPAGSVPLFAPAAMLNFFRPSGLNPTLAGGACLNDALSLQQQLGLGLGVPVPFSDMNGNFSSGSSVYHGLTTNLKKRLSKHYEFLASYTWSHAIDDSTDLQSPLAPQDSYQLRAERANSTFDQRHRFVFSGVYQSGKLAGTGFGSKLLSNWTVAPIVEVGSGRPFTVLSGTSTNFQFAPLPARPNAFTSDPGVTACGDPAVTSSSMPGVYFQLPCWKSGNFDGSSGRNAYNKPTTVFTDMRIARKLNFTERVSLDAAVDIFNLINRFNVADVNPLYTNAGQPTATYDPRQFQFSLKLNW